MAVSDRTHNIAESNQINSERSCAHNNHGEPLHTKTGLKMFVVIPKEDLAGTSPARPSFGMTPAL